MVTFLNFPGFQKSPLEESGFSPDYFLISRTLQLGFLVNQWILEKLFHIILCWSV
jgi:hypothetical protein